MVTEPIIDGSIVAFKRIIHFTVWLAVSSTTDDGYFNRGLCPEV